MNKTIRVSRKRPGRPKTTGTGYLIGMRWHSPDLEAIDAWHAAHPEFAERTEAIRQLVRIGITASKAKVRK